VVGWGEEAAALDPDLPSGAFLWESTSANRLLIGGPELGTLYGIYAFLEEQLGLRSYVPGSTFIPEKRPFALPRLSERRRPAFPVRWVHLPGAEDQAWCDWHGVHSRAHREDFWGMFVHTFFALVPPEEYFDEHPEYFSEIKGQRLPNLQLCLTNEDVFQIVVVGLRDRMAKRPEARCWSVSQNDCHGACQCADCQALVDRHGSQAGPLIKFVNRLAAEFPDHTISTLAYSYTRHAPRDLKPAPNVNICLCSIECDRAQTLAAGERNADFLRDIEQWSALTDNLMIWDYVVQFTHYVSPFPNFHVLQPNIQLFRDHDVQLMFQQGSGNAKSDLSELKQYVIANLLWDPDCDVEALIDDFLRGRYGEAAGQLRSYFDLRQSSLLVSGAGLGIYGNPALAADDWLKPETLLAAQEILAAAERAVEGQPELLARVREVSQPVTYARLEQAKRFGAGESGLFEAAPTGGWQVRDEWQERLEEFTAACNAGGYTAISERSYSPTAYREDMLRFFTDGMAYHLALDKPVQLAEPFNPKYPANGTATLVDGIKGINDYWYSWLGWEAVDMALTVDLEEVRPVSHLAADFLQVVASWVWLPTEVRWFTSLDGQTWEAEATLLPRNPAKRADPFFERFECSFPAHPVRYVRLEATSIKWCPAWHHGAGGDAWIFCDEVMVFK